MSRIFLLNPEKAKVGKFAVKVVDVFMQ